MNIAVLSDIHGNHIALEACLDYLKNRKIDIYCFLGDYTGEFPSTVGMLSRAMDLCYEKHGECEWPKIPEECYATAFAEICG